VKFRVTIQKRSRFSRTITYYCGYTPYYRGYTQIYPLPGLALDLLHRLAMVPLTLGFDYDLECLKRFKEHCDNYVAETGKDAVARLSTLVKEWYIMHGVEWTAIMPDTKYEAIFEVKRLREKTNKVFREKQSPSLFDAANPIAEFPKVEESPKIASPDSDETGLAILSKIGDGLGEKRFDLWFGQDTSCRVVDHYAVFKVRNDFTIKSIRRHCSQEIKAALAAFGLDYKHCEFQLR